MITNMTSKLAAVALLFITLAAIAFAQAGARTPKRRFTVADDIGIAHFGDPINWKADAVIFSADGRYFVVDTERGLLYQNRPQSTIRIYRTEDVRQFISHPEMTGVPLRMWGLKKSPSKDDPTITQIRCLP